MLNAWPNRMQQSVTGIQMTGNIVQFGIKSITPKPRGEEKEKSTETMHTHTGKTFGRDTSEEFTRGAVNKM